MFIKTANEETKYINLDFVASFQVYVPANMDGIRQALELSEEILKPDEIGEMSNIDLTNYVDGKIAATIKDGINAALIRNKVHAIVTDRLAGRESIFDHQCSVSAKLSDCRIVEVRKFSTPEECEAYIEKLLGKQVIPA